MEKPYLELRLRKKQLAVDGRSLDLDPSLFYAGVSDVSNRENETALELRYKPKNREDFLPDESERVYRFLQSEERTRPLEVNFHPDEEFPTISITGEFRASVSSA